VQCDVVGDVREMVSVCLRCSLELHRVLLLSGSSAVVDTHAVPPQQLALPAPPPPTTSAELPVSPAPPSPGSSFTGAPAYSHSLPPGGTAPYPHGHLLGSQLVPPAPPVLPAVLAYDASTGAVFDPRSGLATKIKGGLALASLAKTSNKFSPY